MTTTPAEPDPDPEVVPSGDPSNPPEPEIAPEQPPTDPGEDPGVDPPPDDPPAWEGYGADAAAFRPAVRSAPRACEPGVCPDRIALDRCPGTGCMDDV